MLIKLENIGKRYRRGLPFVVEDISLDIEQGETVGIFGESGSGKSTIGHVMAGIIPPTTGRIYYEDNKLNYPYKGEARRRIQVLFQHPEVSFNPKLTLYKSICEPYKFLGLPCSREKICDYLESFGIYEEHIDRFPPALSGGELQRLALARIMLVQPKLIILDEPTSMLDIISQAQVIQMLKELQHQHNLGYFFISHDRLLCEAFCDRILDLTRGTLASESAGISI